MSADARLLVIQPDDLDPLGRFSDWWSSRGLGVHTIRPFAGDDLPGRVDADGLVVLGGSMSSLDTAEFPWLADVRSLLVDAHAREIPTMGICLGAQLLAQALGGVVEPGANGLEVGAVTVTFHSDVIGEDPIFAGCGDTLTVAQYHSDSITRLPAVAHRLGSSKLYVNQAFRSGNSWGLQFHPEVTPETFARWVAHETGMSPDRDRLLGQALADIESKDADIRESVRHIADRFADLVLAAAVDRV